MNNFNLVYKIKKEKNCEKRSGGSSVNGICFNKIKFLKLLPSYKSVNPLQRSYLKATVLQMLKKMKKILKLTVFFNTGQVMFS